MKISTDIAKSHGLLPSNVQASKYLSPNFDDDPRGSNPRQALGPHGIVQGHHEMLHPGPMGLD